MTGSPLRQSCQMHPAQTSIFIVLGARSAFIFSVHMYYTRDAIFTSMPYLSSDVHWDYYMTEASWKIKEWLATTTGLCAFPVLHLWVQGAGNPSTM